MELRASIGKSGAQNKSAPNTTFQKNVSQMIGHLLNGAVGL